MGYFRGNRIPDYNPFGEEKDYEDEPDYWHWYHLGHSDGFGMGSEIGGQKKCLELEQENTSLKQLIEANYRVMLEEMRKEAKEQIQNEVN